MDVLQCLTTFQKYKKQQYGNYCLKMNLQIYDLRLSQQRPQYGASTINDIFQLHRVRAEN